MNYSPRYLFVRHKLLDSIPLFSHNDNNFLQIIKLPIHILQSIEDDIIAKHGFFGEDFP
jgi:hypothetical protein